MQFLITYNSLFLNKQVVSLGASSVAELAESIENPQLYPTPVSVLCNAIKSRYPDGTTVGELNIKSDKDNALFIATTVEKEDGAVEQVNLVVEQIYGQPF